MNAGKEIRDRFTGPTPKVYAWLRNIAILAVLIVMVNDVFNFGWFDESGTLYIVLGGIATGAQMTRKR